MVRAVEPVRLAFDASGTPYSPHYGDVYHSRGGAMAQAGEVFLAGNGLPRRWAARSSFVVLETGFGLGTNFLATWAAWRADPARPQRLHFISIERHPLSAEDLIEWHVRRALAGGAPPQGRGAPIAPLVRGLAAAWPPAVAGVHRLPFEDDRVVLTLVLGDAEHCAAQLRAAVDAFYLDGFAPARNPDMWSPRLFKRLARLAVRGATFSTYTAAGAVAQGLRDAGFSVAKAAGFAGKRERLEGRYEPRYEPRRPLHAPYREGPQGRTDVACADRTAVVVGAGIAGSCVTRAFARRGWRVDLVETAHRAASGASGGPAGAMHPLIARDDSRAARFSRAGFLHMARLLEQLPSAQDWSGRVGHLQCVRSDEDDARAAAAAAALGLPSGFAEYLDRAQACDVIGTAPARGGYWFPGGAWIRAADLCRTLLEDSRDRVSLQFGAAVSSIGRSDGEWRVCDRDGRVIAGGRVLVVASGAWLASLCDQAAPGAGRPLNAWMRPVRGQMTGICAERVRAPRVVVSGDGFCLPSIGGTVWCGSTYDREEIDTALREADHLENLRRVAALLPQMVPASGEGAGVRACAGYAGIRSVAVDRLPAVGALAEPVGEDERSGPRAAAAGHAGRPLADIPRVENVYIAGGMASRGLTWASLCADIIVSLAEGDPVPLEGDLLDAIDPARFLRKREKKMHAPLRSSISAGEPR